MCFFIFAGSETNNSGSGKEKNKENGENLNIMSPYIVE